jgi:hypothetical protein
MQKVKRILKIILIITILLITVGLGFTFIFGEKIEGIILKKINNKLKSEILVSNIQFSLFSNFPNACVNFNDIFIKSSDTSITDTLLYSTSGFINLNIIDLIREDYSITDMSFENSDLNIIYNENGVSNFNIFIDSNQNTNSLQIENILFSNCDFIYSNLQQNIKIENTFNTVNLSLQNQNNNYSINIDADVFSNHLMVNNEDYLQGKEVQFNSEIEIIGDSILIQSESFKIESVNLENIEYTYFDEEYQLSLNTSSQIEDILTSIPNHFNYLFINHELNGKIDANLTLNKEKHFKNPFTEVKFSLSESEYKSKNEPFHLTNINTTGNFTNGKDRNFKSSKLNLNNFNSKKEKGMFNGKFTLSNLNNYYLNADVYSSWELNELNQFLEESSFKNIKGEVSGNINYNGNLSFDNSMKGYIESSNHTADLDFKDVYFTYKKSPLKFSCNKMNWNIKNHQVKISDSKIQISKSDLDFEGEIEDLILYLIDRKEEIDIKGIVNSEYIVFEELYTITEMNGEGKYSKFVSVLPKWVNSNIQLNIKQFSYNKFESKQLKTDLNYDNKKLKLTTDHLSMETLEGKIEGDFIYFENRIHDLILKANIKLSKINISDGFRSMDNFGQKFMTYQNIKGTATANIYLQSMWDRNYKFYSPSLSMNADLMIEDGELNEFEPMYNLSDYVSLEELKNVKFATLENKIRIENEKIIIPEMDIHSTALSVHISGTHTFENIMDYKIKLLLSDVLGNKAKNKSKNINLEDLNHDHSGKTTVQLNMRGNVDNPKISLDKIKLKEDIVSEIIKETTEIKDIIEEKILNKVSDKKEEKEEESGIEINWEDEK